MRGNTRQVRVLAATLLLLVAATSVEGHGRNLQAQQALHLPHGFKIPNIFNTCEWVGLTAALLECRLMQCCLFCIEAAGFSQITG